MKWDTLAWENGPSPRRWHTFSPMPGQPERLFSYGGYDAPKHPLNDSFILDLGTLLAKAAAPLLLWVSH
jgi:hypothetical protein